MEGGEGAEVWAAFVPKCVWVGECVCGWVGEPECVCVLLVFLSPFLELSVISLKALKPEHIFSISFLLEAMGVVHEHDIFCHSLNSFGFS